MDKRTLLAFAMATVVLIGWSLLFPTKRETPRHETADSLAHWGSGTAGLESAKPGTEGGSGTTSGGSAPARPGLPQTDEMVGGAPGAGGPTWLAPEAVAPGTTGAPVAAAAETLEVDTDLYHARIRTIGGELVGFTLKKYLKGDRSGPVDLVRAGHEALDLGVEWGTDAATGETRAPGQALPLGDARFAAVREAISGDGGSGERIVLTARRTDGLTVTREYRFRDGTYEVGHRAEVTGLPVSDRAPSLVV